MARQIRRLAKRIVGAFPLARFIFQMAREVQCPPREVPDTDLGFKFFGPEKMMKGLFEPEETALFKTLLGFTDYFVNVGANVGYYCCHALQSGLSCVAIEPVPSNVVALCANVKANNWDSLIEIYPTALSDRVGVTEIFGGGTSASLVMGWASTPREYSRLVPILTLDGILTGRLGERRALILIDVEGAELSVLNGAERTLSGHPKPIWFIEVAITEHLPAGQVVNPKLREIFQKFREHGYEARTADRRFKVVTVTDIEEVASKGVNTLDCHNFLFLDPGHPCHDVLRQSE